MHAAGSNNLLADSGCIDRSRTIGAISTSQIHSHSSCLSEVKNPAPDRTIVLRLFSGAWYFCVYIILSTSSLCSSIVEGKYSSVLVKERALFVSSHFIHPNK